ncbi:MAG: hypothetical protein K8J08_02820 [Thermoanaerobaculia bacterium]|nr:hypothetical protein [Thermoanaerobaculia bacterium]
MKRFLYSVFVLLATGWAIAASAREAHEDRTGDAARQFIEEAVAASDQTGQQAAFDRLMALGCSAVPAIVGALPDDRDLTIRYIRITNSPEVFEAVAQYGPEKVTDALVAVLGYLTEQHFGFIHNGASPEDRATTVAAWRAFVEQTPPDQLCE